MGQEHSDGSGQGDRRRSRRHRCRLPVELRSPGVSFPSQGETVDICLGGCYVSSPFTLTVGSELSLKLWVGDTAIHTKAIVRTADPGVGNGLEFHALSPSDQELLKDYLDNLKQDGPSAKDDDISDQLIH